MLRADSLAWTPPGATAPVFAGITAELRPGELVALLGPSGSGKSSLVRCLAGLAAPSAGTVRLANGEAPSASTIAVVFQNPEHQFVAARLDRELAFGLEVRRVTRAEQHAAVGQAAAALGLAGRMAASPATFSAGERQRIAVAAATITSPRFLLADEPTSHLDVRARAAVLAHLRQFADAGIGVLFVTPFEEEAGVADRVWRIDRGRFEDTASADTGVRRDGVSRLARRAGLRPAASAADIAARWRPAASRLPAEGSRMHPLVRVRDALLRHAGHEAWTLRVSGWEIVAGERWVLLGDSGSGKSSLLHALAGVLDPVEGRVECSPECAGGLAYVIQAPERLFHRATAWDELGPPTPAEAPEAEDLLRAVGLDPAAIRSRSAFHFSVGEQRRLAIAAQLLRRPALLLLDEPTAGLDAESAEAVCEVIHRATPASCALVLATHDLGRTAALGTRCALVRHGQIEMGASVADALESVLSHTAHAGDVGDVSHASVLEELLPAWWRVRAQIPAAVFTSNMLPCNEMELIAGLAPERGPTGGLC